MGSCTDAQGLACACRVHRSLWRRSAPGASRPVLIGGVPVAATSSLVEQPTTTQHPQKTRGGTFGVPHAKNVYFGPVDAGCHHHDLHLHSNPHSPNSRAALTAFGIRRMPWPIARSLAVARSCTLLRVGRRELCSVAHRASGSQAAGPRFPPSTAATASRHRSAAAAGTGAAAALHSMAAIKKEHVEDQSGWRSLGTPASELRLEWTLPTGQSFRWRQTGEAPLEFTGVIGQRAVGMQLAPCTSPLRCCSLLSLSSGGVAPWAVI